MASAYFLFVFLTLIGAAFPSHLDPAKQSVDSSPTEDGPVAQTQQGPVQGVHVNDKVSAFLGVPFAQPPVDELRFYPPKIPCNHTGIFNASSFGSVCWQFHYRNVMGENIIETTPQSEDCLTLNIFVPRRGGQAKGLPTLFWLYGGAFSEGGGSMGAYDPTNLVASQSDIIIVTANYRMNTFGFPNSPAIPIDQQNLGLRDQRAALEWLRDNLEVFGGDPTKITFGGQSAGGDSASLYAYAYRDDPIVRGLLLESASSVAATGYTSDPTEEYYRVAKNVGCRNITNSTTEFECMRAVPAKEIRDGISNKTMNLFGYPSGGSPMIDNLTLFSPEDYMKRGEAGEFARLPVFLGMNSQEGQAVLNWSPKDGINQTVADILTLSFFECPISLEASYRSKYNVPVWRYRYFGKFSAVAFFPWLGPYHLAEVPMVLGSYPNLTPSEALTADEIASAALLQYAVGTFVRDPAKGLSEKLNWPMYHPNQTTLVELFHNNTPTYRFEDPRLYYGGCAHPPPIPWDEIAKPPPSV